ncbi:hypothetical protein C0J52_12708 [Blattella germanica]|nr:hypothetical protein C0J52_12708 [Blattella germanica]
MKVNMGIFTHCIIIFLFIVCLLTKCEAIRCYQCSSGQDIKGEDDCGAYQGFDESRHIAIECNSEESYTPGTFCMKITQQGPKGFIYLPFCKNRPSQRLKTKSPKDQIGGPTRNPPLSPPIEAV